MGTSTSYIELQMYRFQSIELCFFFFFSSLKLDIAYRRGAILLGVQFNTDEN